MILALFVGVLAVGVVALLHRAARHEMALKRQNHALRVALAAVAMARPKTVPPDQWTVVYKDGHKQKTVTVHAPTESEAIRVFVMQYATTSIVSIIQG